MTETSPIESPNPPGRKRTRTTPDSIRLPMRDMGGRSRGLLLCDCELTCVDQVHSAPPDLEARWFRTTLSASGPINGQDIRIFPPRAAEDHDARRARP